MWQELFGIKEVSIYDNFFDLEGNSLLAIQLISRLRNTFQVELPLEKLFEEPTVAGLARLIAEGQPGQEELEQLLQEIETLSADEAREELVKESAPADEKERSLG
jgi:acyl carrier protein